MGSGQILTTFCARIIVALQAGCLAIPVSPDAKGTQAIIDLGPLSAAQCRKPSIGAAQHYAAAGGHV